MSSESSSGNEGGPSSTSFYVPQEKWSIWQEFKKIAEREGRSASEILMELIEQYVQTHRKGNPQLILDRFVGQTVLVVGRCFLCGVTDVAWVGSYRLRDGSLRRRLLCDSCKRAAGEGPSWQRFDRIEGSISETDLERRG